MAPKRAISVAEFKIYQHGLALQQGQILLTQFDDNDNNVNKILLNKISIYASNNNECVGIDQTEME